MKATLKPSEFQAACNKLRHADLEPFRAELSNLPVLETKARQGGDIQEVRRIKKREAELHESMLSTAAAGKQELIGFLAEFQPLAEAERKRVDDELEGKKKAREALQKEYEKRAAELDQEIVVAERRRHTVWSDLRTITEMQITTAQELSEQIDESLKVA